VPIYLDSPMAQDATAIFYKHAHEHRLSKDVAREVCHLPHYIQSVEESKALHQSSYPSIIVSASGMLEGGRVLHHLAHFAPHSENAIILTGFQAGGTRGDRIQRGEREVRIHGSMVPIRARVETLESLSSHADYSEVLEWLSSFRSPPRKVFLTHGEPEALEGLKQKIEERFDWTVCVPEYEQEFEL
ncbi:MAG: MBL fold metallo-hydrolase, partial [Chlamydiia bacterium]|nr:MBL fold metallo-hydrolase [Chlamydiia bacterium]